MHEWQKSYPPLRLFSFQNHQNNQTQKQRSSGPPGDWNNRKRNWHSNSHLSYQLQWTSQEQGSFLDYIHSQGGKDWQIQRWGYCFDLRFRQHICEDSRTVAENNIQGDEIRGVGGKIDSWLFLQKRKDNGIGQTQVLVWMIMVWSELITL